MVIPGGANRKKNEAKKRQRNTGYNKDCFKMRSEVRKLKKCFEKNPFCSQTRSRYYVKYKEYKKFVRKSQSEYKNWLLKNMMMLEKSNPKAFWHTLDRLKEETGRATTAAETNITSEQWYSHFKNTCNKSENFKLIPDLMAELKDRENNISNMKCCQNMDSPITINKRSNKIS